MGAGSAGPAATGGLVELVFPGNLKTFAPIQGDKSIGAIVDIFAKRRGLKIVPVIFLWFNRCARV